MSFSCDSYLCWLQRGSEAGSSAFGQPKRADGFCLFEVNYNFLFVFIGLQRELPKEEKQTSSLDLGKKEKKMLGPLMFV